MELMNRAARHRVSALLTITRHSSQGEVSNLNKDSTLIELVADHIKFIPVCMKILVLFYVHYLPKMIKLWQFL